LVYSKTSELNSTQPWVSEKALSHMKKINETFEWIQSKLKKQIDRQLNEDIIFYVSIG
jgi:sensor domain CHASE-containing protein